MLKRIFCFVLLPLLSPACIGAIVVVGHPSAPLIDRNQISQIFLAKIDAFPNGLPAIPVDLPEGEAERNAFYQLLVNKSAVQLKAYWSRLIFTGSGRPPQQVEDSDEVIELIGSSPDVIGYMDAKYVSEKVKVLLTLE